MQLSKERVKAVLGEIVEHALNSKGIDDDGEYMKEILFAEEYARQCVDGYTPDPAHMREYMKNNVG